MARRPAKRKSHRNNERPPFDRIVLLLQGGGALGSYQAGVYQAMAEANLEPDWVAGISIGAINCAIIAGNPPEKRIERLHQFWEAVSSPPFGVQTLIAEEIKGDVARRAINQLRAFGILLGGAPGFFSPRMPPPYLHPSGSAEALSFYDVAPLKATLERLVDFDLINADVGMRFSVGAVNVRTGNFVYFDSTTHQIGPEHIMASGALPPGFPAAEIDGEYYWDGGIVSNTPLEWVLDSSPRQDTLAFQVDLWSARGELPRDLMEAEVRQKEIRFSSRTRAGTDRFRKVQMLRRAALQLLKQLPGKAQERAVHPADRGGGRRARLQHHPDDLPREELRKHFQGLRVLAADDGRALARRLQRRRAHAAPSGSPAAPGRPVRCPHLRPRARRPRVAHPPIRAPRSTRGRAVGRVHPFLTVLPASANLAALHALSSEGEQAMAQPYEFRGNTYRKLAELKAWTGKRQEAALEPDLPIIDPHHHLWDDERGPLPDPRAGGGRRHRPQHRRHGVHRVRVRCTARDGPEDMKPVGEVEFVNGIAAMSASGNYGKTPPLRRHHRARRSHAGRPGEAGAGSADRGGQRALPRHSPRRDLGYRQRGEVRPAQRAAAPGARPGVPQGLRAPASRSGSPSSPGSSTRSCPMRWICCAPFPRRT